MTETPSDVLVLFGASGDLAHKKIYPALQAMVRRGTLKTPVIGIARRKWSQDEFKAQVRASLSANGPVDEADFAKLAALLRYVDGDYDQPKTYELLREAVGGASNPLYYLAIPPTMFSTVAERLAAAGSMKNARVIIEKPFGRDLASAKKLNQELLQHLPESAIFRIDHYLGKEPVQNLVYFRFANPLVECGWNRESIESVQITMAENFGVAGRGKFYEEAGAIRDVLQNHMLQLVACLAMECPGDKGDESLRDERGQLIKSIRTLDKDSVVRGQFTGYRQEAGVAPDSTVETFAAARFAIDNERWAGVPFFVRVGKCLPVTVTEIFVRLKNPGQKVISDCKASPANYYRFRISPEAVIAIGARVKKPGEAMAGVAVELMAHHKNKDEMEPYERLLGDAAKGDASLFARQDAVEESWRIVDPVLAANTPVHPYAVGTWGPTDLPQQLIPDGGWHNPVADPKQETPLLAGAK